MKKKKNKILLICRYKDVWSDKIVKILKNNFTYVTVFYSKSYNQKITQKINSWRGDYILSFRSLLILPKKILKNAKIASINFHPGPPEYRGVGCLNYAVYNGEKYYGVTAHLMRNKIDFGEILKISRFKISKIENLDKILLLTHHKLFLLAEYFIKKIISNKLNLKMYIQSNKENWSKVIKLKSDLDKFYIIDKNITKKNLEKKLKATITNNFKPYIIIHNKKFYFKNEN